MPTAWMVITGWLLGWLAFGRPRHLRAPRQQRQVGRSDGATLSVIIPARNEAHSLPLLLGDLERSRPAGCEVIVVDDDSSDSTAEIVAQHAFATLVHSDGPPRGAAGKPWSCHLGSVAARGDLLCFLDADVRLAPGALDVLCQEIHRREGLLSVQPWHAAERPYEQASSIFNVISVMGTGIGGLGEPDGAYGPVMVTRRVDYETAGGHLGVSTEIVEDVALAAAYRREGLPVEVLTGGEAVAFRMYPDGWASLVEGWTKNIASGAGMSKRWRLAAAVLWIIAMGSTVGPVVEALAGRIAWWWPALAYLAFVVQLRLMFRTVGRFGWTTATLFPGLVVTFLAIFARSLWCTKVRRRVTWRGRSIAVGSAAP